MRTSDTLLLHAARFRDSAKRRFARYREWKSWLTAARDRISWQRTIRQVQRDSHALQGFTVSPCRATLMDNESHCLARADLDSPSSRRRRLVSGEEPERHQRCVIASVDDISSGVTRFCSSRYNRRYRFRSSSVPHSRRLWSAKRLCASWAIPTPFATR